MVGFAMRWIAIASIVIGCGKSPPPAQPVIENSSSATEAPAVEPRPGASPPPGDAETAIRELRAIQVRMCACKDRPCADRVFKDMEAMSQRYASIGADDDQTKRANDIATSLIECMVKAQQTP
jgi:hypothetical protein